MSARRTILVADDEENDVLLLQCAFAKAGVDVQMNCVRDGQEAIRYLEDPKRKEKPIPELVLLDLKMPRIGGFEVLEWVRKQPRLKRLLVIIFSSSDAPEDIERAYHLGADSYMVKPCGLNHLTKLVENLTSLWLNNNCRPTFVAG